jgi:hypothetical protein
MVCYSEIDSTALTVTAMLVSSAYFILFSFTFWNFSAKSYEPPRRKTKNHRGAISLDHLFSFSAMQW